MSTNEQCITSATQYYLFIQYCENILFVLTEDSYLKFTLCKLSCNGGTPIRRDSNMKRLCLPLTAFGTVCLGSQFDGDQASATAPGATAPSHNLTKSDQHKHVQSHAPSTVGAVVSTSKLDNASVIETSHEVHKSEERMNEVLTKLAERRCTK